MDDYEDEGDLYIRRLLEIETDSDCLDAWVYEYNCDVTRLDLRAPAGKWSMKKRPISDYVWYVCYGSNLLRERFDDYLKRTDSKVYAEKPYMLDGEIYFAKKSSKWDDKGICFLDLNKKDHKSYGWAYLLEKDKIDAIRKKEGPSLYPSQDLGKDEYGIKCLTLSSSVRYQETKPGSDYLKVIAAGLKNRFNLSENQIRRYLNCDERLSVSDDELKAIFERHLKS